MTRPDSHYSPPSPPFRYDLTRMGTRHQIYIIAQVLGCYRVVAVFHIQSLYPPEAVHLAWCLLQLIENHTEPIEKELRCLKENSYSGRDTEYPCPYLAALLFQRVQDFYGPYKGTYPEDNNSGFTVIDVTDPDSPAYCFWGWSGDYGFSPGYPIAPKAYALRYYTEDEGERMFEDLDREVQNAIREIQNWRFIGRKDILSEAWESVESPMPAGIEEEPLSHGSEEFMKALRTVIGTGNAEDAQRMADKISTTHVVVESLRKTLRRETLPEHCNPILNKVFVITQELSRSDELDLSWMQLSPTQISQIVQAVVQTYSFKISGLDISGNDTITEETLSEIFKLEKAKDIKRVFLFGCSKVEDIRRADMPGRIGADEGVEVFNSYFPASLSEFRPWDTGSS
ncbi:hypothetical protein FRC05_000349 [Tulasnella sp. 425]|nr:hypothetical protein FRC05_000349 [Tulasnella sp. 425]